MSKKVNFLGVLILSVLLFQSCEKKELDYVNVSHYEIDSNGQLRVIGDYENWKTINSIIIKSDTEQHSVYVNSVSLEYFSEHKVWKDETIMVKKSNKENVALEVFVRSKKNFPIV